MRLAFGRPVAVAGISLKCSELLSKVTSSEQATVSDLLPISLRATSPPP